jgi:diaminohydroxyphosphoribosylaminopyrimidine deaminase/5-amino-6-(5-phosphoribosylamino)uracil reductase
MRRALDLARRGWGRTTPNPMVGAVIVEDGVIVAEGFHAEDGGPHAERVAFAALGRPPKPDATLYVTLEPCSTHGRTGACCDLIRESGVCRVVVGATDPFPDHAGRAFVLLRQAGIEVIPGVLESECTQLNILFNHWIVKRTPAARGQGGGHARRQDRKRAPPTRSGSRASRRGRMCIAGAVCSRASRWERARSRPTIRV